MMIAKSNTLNDLTVDLLQLLNNFGVKVGNTTEVCDVEAILLNPRNRHLYLKGRTNNIYSTIAEFIWVMAGDSKVDPFLSFYLPKAKNYANEVDGELVWSDCFPGDTKISLLNGTEVEIKDLVGLEEFWVYSCTPEGEIVPGRGHSARKVKKIDEVCEITLDNGDVIESTIDHPYMMLDGSYTEAQKLDIGMCLMPLDRKSTIRSKLGDNPYSYADYELILDNKTQSLVLTHRLVGMLLEQGDKRVVHHKDGNTRNNEPGNLEWLTDREHWVLRHGVENLSRINEMRSQGGYYDDTYEFGKMLRDNLKSGNDKMKMAFESNDELGQKLRKVRANNCLSLNSDKEIRVLQIKGGIKNRYLKIVESGMEFNKENYNKFKHRGGPRWESLLSYFSSYEECIRFCSTKNHSVVSKRIIEKSVDVYDITVDEYNNFALTAGVFVHNSYGPRINQYSQIEKIISLFKEDITTRKAVMSIFNPNWDSDFGKNNRGLPVSAPIPCFSGDTKVRTINGMISIQDIQEGDVVFSFNEKTRETELNKVLCSGKTDTVKSYLKITLSDGSEIKCTHDHIMYLSTNWNIKDVYTKRAVELQIGDIPLRNRTWMDTSYYAYKYYYGKYPGIGYCIHHKNLNHLDNSKENLELMTIGEHNSLHRTINNPAKTEAVYDKRVRNSDKYPGITRGDYHRSWSRDMVLKEVYNKFINGEIEIDYDSYMRDASSVGLPGIGQIVGPDWEFNGWKGFKKELCDLYPDVKTILDNRKSTSSKIRSDRAYRSITKIEEIFEEIDVYDIKVENNKNFELECNWVVHNCNDFASFWIRDNKFYMKLFNRSSDLLYGLCLTGDTKISLLNGTEVPIQDLVGLEEFWVYSCTPEGQIVPGRGHSARITKYVDTIYEITLDNGEIVKCTDNHPFMMRDGSYTEAKDLKINDSLMPLYRKSSDQYINTGYEEVLHNDGSGWEFTHRVSAYSYSGIEYKILHHIDLDYKNNYPNNLQWVTPSEHSYIHKFWESAWPGDTRSEFFRQYFKDNPEAKERFRVQERWNSDYDTMLNAVREGNKKRWSDPEESARQSETCKRSIEERERRKREIPGYKETMSNRMSDGACGRRYNSFVEIANKIPDSTRLSIEEFKVEYDKIFYSITPVTNRRCLSLFKREFYDRYINHNHKVSGIRKVMVDNIPVYDVTVDNHNNFALTSGVFVHNSNINIFEFTLLQEIIWSELKQLEQFRELELGYYHHSIMSLHYYDYHQSQINSINTHIDDEISINRTKEISVGSYFQSVTYCKYIHMYMSSLIGGMLPPDEYKRINGNCQLFDYFRVLDMYTRDKLNIEQYSEDDAYLHLSNMSDDFLLCLNCNKYSPNLIIHLSNKILKDRNL